ncbi:MAG: hypothetical protein HYZ36_06330 [Pedosphaera parvula]|nr:hypothetical protein [Pedosphaera parvula]
MDNEQARFILQAYRPNGQDAHDPQFQEALEQVQRDPELARWFAAEQALDSAISRKLKSAPVPPDLKSTILAGRKVIHPKHWWEHPPVVALAAALAFLLVAAGYWLQTKSPKDELTLAAFQRDMAAAFGAPHQFHGGSQSGEQIRQWLAQHGGQADFASPAALKNAKEAACDVLDWRGRKVTLICYVAKLNGAMKEMHLVVIDQADLPGVPRVEKPQFAKVGDHATAAWTQGDKIYVLAAQGDVGSLRKFL